METGVIALSFGEIQGRQEAGVHGDLVAGNESVGFIGHADDLLELFKHFRGHAFAEGGSGMGVNAVLAIIGDADGDVEELFGERIERAGIHDGFQIFPGALQKNGVVGNGFPKIVDVVRFARGHDVVVDRFYRWAGVFVFDETESGHEDSPWKMITFSEHINWNPAQGYGAQIGWHLSLGRWARFCSGRFLKRPPLDDASPLLIEQSARTVRMPAEDGGRYKSEEKLRS
jgi:hypothetical protein